MFRSPVQAVHQLNLGIERGEVVAFVGPNGAGKTTTIYMVLGFLRPDAGTIRIFGMPPEDPNARRRVGFQSEIFFTYPFLTAKQTLTFYGRLSGMSAADISSVVPRKLERLGLGQAIDRKVGTFSKGMVQRVGLAQALLHRPDILILDEPTTGLDPEGRKLVADLILEEKKRGTTVFLSSHILSDVERTCDRVVMIRQGEIVYSERMDAARRESDEWEVDVSGWTPVLAASLDGLDCNVATSADGRARLGCRTDAQREVLRRIAASDARIDHVRRKGASLEDLYLQYLGGTSSG